MFLKKQNFLIKFLFLFLVFLFPLFSAEAAGSLATENGQNTADEDLVLNLSGTRNLNWKRNGLPFARQVYTLNSKDPNDYSGNGFHGTSGQGNASPNNENDGILGGSYNFGGNDFINIPREISDNFTIEAWIRPDNSIGASCGSNGWFCGIGIVDGETSGVVDDFGLAIRNNRVLFGVGRPDVTLFSSTVLSPNNWYHLVATRDRASGTIRLYINGQEESVNTNTSKRLLNSPPNLRIGQMLKGTGSFDGNIDEVRLYDHVLTPAQIVTNYNNGNPNYKRIANKQTGLGDQWQVESSEPHSSGDRNFSSTNIVSIGTLSQPIVTGNLNTTNGNNTISEDLILSTTLTNPSQMSQSISFRKNGAPFNEYYFSFNNPDAPSGNGNVLDFSGHSRHQAGGNGNFLNSPKWIDKGILGGAYFFDGYDNFIEIPNISVEDFTLEAWVKPHTSLGSSCGSNGWYCGLGIIDGETSGVVDDFGLVARNNKIIFGTGRPDVNIFSTTTLVPDTWFHVVATRDRGRGEIKLYINGAEEAQAFASKRALNSPSSLRIGAMLGNRGFFPGTLDEIRIYSHVLTQEQIAANYKGGTPDYKRIVKEQTGNGETWQTVVTPHNYFQSGNNLSTNEIILETSVAPSVSASLETSLRENTENEDLLLTTNIANPLSMTESIDWRVDGKSINNINLSFNAQPVNGEVEDYSDAGNKGILGGGNINESPKWVGNGIIGGAMDFDGINDYIQIPRLVSEDFSIEVWVKSHGSMGASCGSNGWFCGLGIVDGESSGVVDDFGLSVRNNKVLFGVGRPDITLFSTTSLEEGEWVHIVATRNRGSGEMKLFINGTQESQAFGSKRDLISPPVLHVGGMLKKQGFFLGLIDELKIYDRALSPNQVAAFYNGGAPHYKKIVHDETHLGQRWQIETTPSNYFNDGAAIFTDVVPIGTQLNASISAVLTGENGNNSANENLLLSTVGNSPGKVESSFVWKKNGTPLNTMALTFNTRELSALPNKVLDYSGNGNHGQLGGGDNKRVPKWTNGIIGGVYDFDGIDDYISIPRSVEDDFTIEAWINPDSNIGASCGSNGWFCGIGIVDGESSGVIDDFGLSVRNNRILFGTGRPDITIFSTTVLEIGNWYHLVATRNRTTGEIKLFVNGSEEASAVTSTRALNSPSSLRIGSMLKNQGFFDGKIDEVRFYDQVLPTEQIVLNYNSGNPSYKELSSQLTSEGDTWAVDLTPSNYFKDSALTSSNALVIGNGNPPQMTASLVTENGLDTSSENLIVNFASPQGAIPAINWIKNGNPLSIFNASFNKNISTTTFGEIKDYSGNNFGGQLGAGDNNAAPNWVNNGYIGGAYDFDGNDDVIVFPNVINNQNAFTFSFWMNIDSFTDEFYMSPVCKNGTTSGPGFCFFVSNENGNSGFQGKWEDDSSFDLRQTINWNPGSWEHVVVTYDGVSLRQYINGKSSHSGNYLSKSFGGNTNLSLGQGRAYPQGQLKTTFFDGKIDEVKIDNYAWTPEQVTFAYREKNSGEFGLSKYQTKANERWQAELIPVTEQSEGGSVLTNLLNVENNAAPVGNVSLQGGAPSQDLLATVVANDPELNQTFSSVRWLRDGTSVLEGKWSFDTIPQNGVLKDYATGANPGTMGSGALGEAPRWVLNGLKGGALWFDGENDFVNLGNLVTDASNFTFAFWVNILDFSDQFYMSPICQNDENGTNNTNPKFCFYISEESDSSGFQGNWNNSTPFDLRTTVNWNKGAWHYVVVTYDGNELKQFVDGQLTSSSVDPGKSLGNGHDFLIGEGHAYPEGVPKTTFFDGMIDELEFYEEPFSEAQVALAYNNGNYNDKVLSSSFVKPGESWQVEAVVTDTFSESDSLGSTTISSTGLRNVSGYAWGSNIGWISHNATDPGASGDYGVTLENDGKLTGYAWSSTYGWIDYDPQGPYPEAPNYSAELTPCSTELSGWIKILSLGDQGWVSLKNDSGNVDYGVLLNPTNFNFQGFGWSETLGWIQYDPSSGGVSTTATFDCAQGNYNLSGFAWSDVAGWISHNASDTGTSLIDYGVNLEEDGSLKGFAWSDNVGWVQYDPVGPYPAIGPNHSAKYNSATGNITGWAKVSSLGDLGWIAMNSQGGSSFGVSISPIDADLKGFAWNDTIGWVDYDPLFGGVEITDPNLISPGPETPRLVKPVDGNETWLDYPEFRNSSLAPTLSWSAFKAQGGGNSSFTQKEYQVQVATDAGFGNIIYDRTISSSGNSHAMLLPSPLDYNNQYFWRVSVTDTGDRKTPFGEIGVNGESNNFRTPLHKAPDASFTMNPTEVNAKVEISFFDTSTSFGGSSIVNWRWDFGEGTVIEGNDPSVHKNPKYSFISEGPKTIELTVRDSSGYEGRSTLNINASLPLPDFRRTIPR